MTKKLVFIDTPYNFFIKFSFKAHNKKDTKNMIMFIWFSIFPSFLLFLIASGEIANALNQYCTYRNLWIDNYVQDLGIANKIDPNKIDLEIIKLISKWTKNAERKFLPSFCKDFSFYSFENDGFQHVNSGDFNKVRFLTVHSDFLKIFA